MRVVSWRAAMARLLAAVLFTAAWPTAIQASVLAVEIDPASGLPRLVKGGEVMSAGYAFWRADWAWANLEIRAKPTATFESAFDGMSASLGMVVTGTVARPAEGTLRWQWNFNASAPVSRAVGGGVVFRFDDAWRSMLGDPILLPGNRGWRWGRENTERVEMRFDPPLPALYFERGDVRELRAFFYSESIPAGPRTYTATLTASGGAVVRPSLAQRLGVDRMASWPGVPLSWSQAPVDLSFLNEADRPAGKLGFVRAQGDRLVYADGSPARFWGTNLSAYAIFSTPREQVCPQARRLARLGFNLVRLHHHDSYWAEPNVFGPPSVRSTGELAPDSMARIDWWVKCLRDEGIRVWLDLHVQRRLKAGDGIDHFEELLANGNQGDLKGFNYVNRSVQQAMERFALQYLGHRNPHTGLTYVEDPAVMGVLLTNENDVTHHFGNKLLQDKGVPRHWDLLKAASDAFAQQHRLPRDRTWRTWEHGPPKLFLNDLERRVHVATIARLRQHGLKVPVATTNFWGDNPMSALPALTAGDVVDAHAYGRAGELDRNPLFQATLAHRLAVAQVAGRPFTVTEWNLDGYPAPDRHALPLYVAATAAHQGWDAVMLYAYAQQAIDGPGIPENWHAMNDPALMVPIAAAALLYRQGHVREAVSTYAWAPTAQVLFGTPVTPDNAPGLRTAVERGKLVVVMPETPELQWLQRGQVPVGATVLRDHATPVLPSTASSVRSDHGELERDWTDGGVFRISTARTQAVSGWTGGVPQRLPDVEFALTNVHGAWAAQSLDDRPIASSRQILLTLATVSMPGAGTPALFVGQPAEGTVTVRAPPGLSAFVPREGRLEPATVPVTYADGRYTIRLAGREASTWMVLRARPR